MFNTVTKNSNSINLYRMFDDLFYENQKSFNLSYSYWTETKDGDNVLVLEIPGLDKNAAKITVKNEILHIKGSIESDFYKKEVNKQYLLPEGTDVSKIKVSLNNGVATIIAPRLQSQKLRQIDIE